MRLHSSLLPSLLATLTIGTLAAPELALAESKPIQTIQLAQAAGGPPTSGWGAPGAAPGPAGPAAPPPNSGWAPPGAGAAPGAPPGGPAPGGWSGTAAGGGGGGRDCGGEFLPLRADAEKKAAAIKAAAATKKQPAVCAAFKSFASAEAKVIKYVEDYGAECRIPPEASKVLRANHTRTLEIRTKVCDTAAAPQPRAPSLSDALGTNRVPTTPQDNAVGKKGGSTFDTLTGNSLNR